MPEVGHIKNLFANLKNRRAKIAVVGLGYVGLTLAHAFSLKYDVVGFDLNAAKIEVLRAAGTKWNFLKFFPGLVGGHCIGVDPYYLTYKAEEVGYHPEVILSGRRINDNMGKFVAENTVKKRIRVGKAVKGAKVLVLGLTFKENVGDIRNTKVVDIISELAEYGVESLVFDPYANAEEVIHEYGDILRSPQSGDTATKTQSGDTIPNSSNSGHVPRLLTGHVPGLLTGHVPGLLVPALEAVPAVDAVARAR